MTSVKVKFRPSTVDGKEGRLYYQIIHNSTVRFINTPCKVFPSEWDGKREAVIRPSASADDRRGALLQRVQEQLTLGRMRLRKIIMSLDDSGLDYTVDDVAFHFREWAQQPTFFAFMRGEISRLYSLGRVRTAETYLSTLRSFATFRRGLDVALDEWNADLAVSYEACLKAEGIALNTISFYMRILRAVYNRAVDCGLTEQRYPFRRVYTGIEKTRKRAVPLTVIRHLKQLDLSADASLDFTRDMFLFSFYTRGMSFVDMAYLRRNDLKGGFLTYRRRKTGQRLCIRWEGCMQALLDKYPVNESPYLLPIIRRSDDERRQYLNAIHLVNRQLKTLSRKLGLSSPLTMYVARHSWASIARSKHIPLSVISEGMGHHSERTTQIYLASLGNVVIDRANSRILKEL